MEWWENKKTKEPIIPIFQHSTIPWMFVRAISSVG